MNNKPASARDLAMARADRYDYFHAEPARGPQMAFAFVDAAIANPHHKQAKQVGRVVRRLDI